MATAKPRPKHRSYTFLGLTQSLCPECREVVPAKIVARGRRVYFRKVCPQHGEREDFVCSDVSRYDRLDDSQPAKLPQRTYAPVREGCPKDCGLCSEHEQHTCIAVIEVTDGCNLTCPMCYAASAPGQAHKPADQIKAAIDRVVEAEGHAEVVQLSGGEPTLHPELLPLIRYALDRPIDYVMVNTNGIRFAHDRELVNQIAEHRDRVEIYFQLDSLLDSDVAQLRGQAGLVETKLKALENLSQAGLNVTLVSTLQGGVNESAPADLVDFAAGQPCITGLSFQPATYSGRYVLPEELENRITFPDVVDRIAGDARNAFTADDFFPLPCAHPNCHWLGLALRDTDGFVPLTQLIDTKTHIDLLANGISFTREQTQQIAAQILSRVASGGESGCCTPGDSPDVHRIDGLAQMPTDEQARIDAFLEQVVKQTVGARDILRITITSFLDIYNFDLRRVMKCCTHHVLPSGHIIPFCAYNVLYRDGTVPLPKLDS